MDKLQVEAIERDEMKLAETMKIGFNFVILDADNNVIPASFAEYKAFDDAGGRVVAVLEMEHNGKKIMVSTVLLPFKHPCGNYFETMAFVDDKSIGQQRCLTYVEAVKIHDQVVAGLQARIDKEVRGLTYHYGI